MSGGGVMLSGWLRKSPPERKLGSRHYSWKKRWFVLKSGRLTGDPNVLEYSKYQTSKKPIKIINLIDCSQIDINVDVPVRTDKKDTASHFVFAIVTNSRTFYLVADSIREMSTWVHCLCDLCGFCHDSNDKADLGNEKQTFKAGQPNTTPPVVNGSANATSSLLPTTSDTPPAPLPRPEKTLSKPTEPHHESNGTVNSSFIPTQNGYDIPEEEVPFREGGFSGQSSRVKDSYRGPGAFLPPELPVHPPEDNDSNGYLHLADCETATNEPDSAFLTVEKCDERRSSTDSVFAHDEGSGDSKDDDSPALPISIQPTSRFLQAQKARLSSMPDCPPPPPPVNVSPYCGDDDEDEVTEARTRGKRALSRPGNNRLPPIDDTGLYNVPPGLQQWKESNSSYGSYSGHQLSPPEYINTQDSKSSGSFSSASHQSPPGPGAFSGMGPTSISNAGLFGNQLYDVPSPMSPVFPLLSSSQQLYQSPRALERTIAPHGVEQNLSPIESSMKNKLRNVTLLDVGNVVHRPDQHAGTNMQDFPKINTSEIITANNNTENPYSVPPARPPKPGEPQQSPNSLKLDSLYDCPRNTTPSAPQNITGFKTESLYDSPRSRSDGSFGSKEHSTYDTVKSRMSPLSPPHATVIGSIPDTHMTKNKPFNVASNTGYRNAISATNSPLATPDLPRRTEIIKTPSFNNTLSPLVQQNKSVSGSAPSLYDVPQPLAKSPGDFYVKKEVRSSQSSSTSGENSAVDGNNLYDMPRKLSDIRSRSPSQQYDSHSRIDDATFPGYEKMASQGASDEVSEDQNPYTIMAGFSSVPGPLSFTSQVPPAHLPIHTKLASDYRAKDSPPPVHRDLKPGRKSLGSDDGSTHGGLERKKTSRDSCESDEAVSPPHTTILHQMPIVSEPKLMHYGGGFSPVNSRSSSITSPQHNKIGQGVDFGGNRLTVSPNPPQRPPKSTTSISSLSPRSPPGPMQLNQSPGRPYTPTQSMHKIPQVIQDRHYNNQMPSTDAVPERPPKPANMRYQGTTNMWDSVGMPPKRPPKTEEHGFAPSRPPKPSMASSSGDSILSSASSLSGTFFPHGSSFYGPSSVVPPPPSESHDREIKYIEISTPGNPKIFPPDIGHDRNIMNDPVEYMQIDPDKTRALERMKKERLQQRANSDAHSMRGKDKSDSYSMKGKD